MGDILRRPKALMLIGALALVAMALAGVALTGRTIPGGSTAAYAAETPPPVTRAPVRVSIVGDSFTAAAGTGNPSASYANVMCSRLNWTCDVGTFPGAGFVAPGTDWDDGNGADHSFPNALQSIIENEPDIIILAGGRSDLTSPVDAVAASSQAFVASLRDALPDARVVIVTGFSWDTDADAQHIQSRDSITGALRASGDDLTVVDVSDTIAVTDESAESLLLSDGVYLSEEGHRSLSTALINVFIAGGYPLGPEVWKQTHAFSKTWEDRVSTGLGLDW